MNWIEHNRKTSRYMQKRSFLERKLAQHQHGKHDPKDPFRNERMANLYRREISRLEAR